ncbi:hypothetical protein [Streptomyces sp. NPDC059080]|uniref:hypothetical protein n=1 Tax=Streptomyces sp. NPDC059080 TaxID=3346718 RepID=UPI0036C348EC
MVEQQVPGRHAGVIEAVRGMEEAVAEKALLSVGATSRRLAGLLGVNDTTALRYLREVIASGKLIEIDHAGRRMMLPWPAEVEAPPDCWATGEVKRGNFRMTAHREVGPAMSKIRFVFTPERLKRVMNQAVAEAVERAAEKQGLEEEWQAKRAAKEAEGRAVFVTHYPVLAGLLSRLHEQVHVSEDSARGVSFHATEHPRAGVVARVSIEVDDERFGVLEGILNKALGD